MHVLMGSRHVGCFDSSPPVSHFHSKSYHHGHPAGMSPAPHPPPPTLTPPSTMSGPQAICSSSPRRCDTSWPPSPSKPLPVSGTKVCRPTARSLSCSISDSPLSPAASYAGAIISYAIVCQSVSLFSLFSCHAYAPCTHALPPPSVNPWAYVTPPLSPNTTC